MELVATRDPAPGSIHALVVDDGPVERLAGKTMLERLGFSVTTATNGEDALLLMERQPVDLVLCDISMPGMSGLSLLETVRKKPRPPLFIMSTTFDDAEHAVGSLHRGAYGYLTKPLRFDSLRQTVAEAMSKYRQEQDVQRRAIELAERDALTGLVNKNEFRHRLDLRLQAAKCDHVCGAVMLIKIRGLSYINHSYGRSEGDKVVQHAAAALSASSRAADDLLGRLGGDLFALYLDGVAHAGLEDAAAAVLEAAEARKAVIGNEAFSLALVAGAACAFGKMEVDELLSQADFALHLARESGRQRLRFYRSEDEIHKRELSQQLNMLAVVRDALAAEGRLVMHYQPIIDLDSGKVSHFEALLRIFDDNGRPCNTGDLVKTCEVFGLIERLDRAVIRRCLTDMSRLPDNAGVAINLSGKSIGDPELLKLIESEIASRGIDPARVIFELTETAAFYNLEEVRHFVGRIKSLGCRFALDDFGVGFSSFYYIKELEFDYLKIDGSFIVELKSNPDDQAFVRAMVEISRVFGLKVIAEWVEDRVTTDLLREFGVRYGQGYYFGKPLPLQPPG
ncbi:MAG TPA: EAL domain-containing protein [Paucimonas sp.]|nr:EAL domain-containing protein [Paucimonas sp.]